MGGLKERENGWAMLGVSKNRLRVIFSRSEGEGWWRRVIRWADRNCMWNQKGIWRGRNEIRHLKQEVCVHVASCHPR